MQVVNKVNFKIGGPAGTGVATVGALFAKCLQRTGLEAFGTNDYPSLIKGGHNTYAVRAGPDKVHSLMGKVDILIALDKKTIELHSNELSDGAAIIYDSGKIKGAEELVKPGKIKLIGVPLTELAVKAGGAIMFNTVALGASMGLMHLDFAILEKLVSKMWRRKGQRIVDENIAAAKAGYEFSKDAVNGTFKIKIEQIQRDRKKMLINGNEASVIGAVKAGCKFVAEYPMSPSSSVLHLMAGHERDFGVIVKQTEDELAAANMIAGAGFAGARAMTATSGGGFSLMAEALGMMGLSETPCVIFEVQRCGPSTGLPTYTEQADLNFVLHASQGEFPRVVIAPGDQTDCFKEAVNAFNISELVQTPVVVLLDKYLAESSMTVEDFREIKTKVDRGKLMTDEQMQKQKNFKRHSLTNDGISPRCLPGQENGMHVCSSYEHDETGFSSEEPGMRINQIDKRAKKLSAIPDEIIAPTFYGEDESKGQILLVCWGSTKGPMLEALKVLEERGIKARMMHICYASPFPSKPVLLALNKFLESKKKTIIFEGNSEAQMRGLILQKTGYYIENTRLRYDGRPFTPEEIVSHVEKMLKK